MTDKLLLRRSVQIRRDDLPREERDRRSTVATELLDPLLRKLGEGPVSLFMSLRHEIDTTLAIEFLANRGQTVLLPRPTGAAGGLSFHAYRRGDPLLPSRFGVLEPTPMAPRLDPRILVVPMLAFDSAGRRLGYGAGHYDRSLRDLRARRAVVAIGFALALQEEPELPEEPHDQRVDWLVTEESVRACA